MTTPTPLPQQTSRSKLVSLSENDIAEVASFIERFSPAAPEKP